MEYLLAGRVFDGQAMHENWVVRIDSETGKIVEAREGRVSPSARKRGPANRNLVTSKDDVTILPGLIDAHVHFFGAKGSGINEWATTPDALAVLRSVSDLRRLLRAGFTSVRELGTKAAVYLARAAEEGHFESPRIISCSRALAQTGGDDDPSTYPLEIGQTLASYSYFCDGPWECRRAVRKVVRDGGKVVKLYASGGFAQGGKVRLQLTQEEIKAIVDEAHRSGIKVAAHAYGEDALVNALRAGVDSIEHGLGLTPGTAKMIRDRGVYYVPTLVTYRKTKPSANPAREKMVARHFDVDMQLVKKYSIRVAMGSDIVGDETRPHGRNYEEIVEEAKFLGNKEALTAATSRAAECIDLPNVGRIKKGFESDVIIVRGNPLKDIQALAPENVLHIFKSGKLYSNT
jgi:imidazolonepropionase-like amidohydrolase